MSSPVYPTIRPSAEPPAPGLRAVLAYLWSERLVTGGHAIGTALAEALAAYPDGTFPGVGTLRTDDAPDDDATDTVFDWKAYLGTLGVSDV